MVSYCKDQAFLANVNITSFSSRCLDVCGEVVETGFELGAAAASCTVLLRLC